MKNQLLSILVLFVFITTSFISTLSGEIIPVTADVNLSHETVNIKFHSINFIKFNQFIKSVTNKRIGNQFVGMIAPNHFNLPITQQPIGRARFCLK